MSHRRAPSAVEKGSLHRCAIALCSNQAVAEGVCAMHLSRPSDAAAPRFLSSGEPPAASADDGERFYRAGAHAAMQPRAGPVAKKQRSDAQPSPLYGSAAPVGPTPLLTRESLSKFTRATYEDSSYLSPESMGTLGGMGGTGSNPGSNRSESEDGSMDHDRESNQRRERNRIAARKSRQRKLDRISNLEEEKMRLEQHRDMLVQEIRTLERKDSGSAQPQVLTITDREYQQLQSKRMAIIQHVEDAYNSGDILSIVRHFRDDSIVSGPQNSSVHLRGKDAVVLDYICTTYLFGEIDLQHTKIDCGGPRSQHFRVHWVLTGKVKSAGVSMNKEFLELIESVKGRRVTIEGVSNFSFSGDKIVYVHRTADQAKFLSALVQLSKS